MLHADELPGDQEPTGQAMQADEDCAATTDDMDPALHPVQVATPPNEYDPGQHAWHWALPSTGVWYPAEHGWQSTWPGEEVKCPTSHTAHVALDVAAVAAENFPASHRVHSLKPRVVL